MKKKNTVLIILASSFLVCGAFLGIKDNKAEKASAYSTSSLPTTIDLNDTSDANIRKYYSSLNSLDASERQGNNLLKNLKTILKNGQKYYSYDGGNAIWQIYEIADRDWAKSPASSTTYGTYNSTTNKITGYTYGTGSGSSAKNNPYIHALYINRNVTNETRAWGNHNQDQWGINREHVWPKAEGFETEGSGGARGDPMHLMAGNGYSNNIHSNYYYGYVKTSVSYTDCGSKYSNQSGNLRGTSKTLNSGTVFEPQDCDKGDIARAIFYMVARYNYISGSDSDGIDSNNPNLALTQNVSDWENNGYSSTTTKTGKMGILTDLLAWHHADPVDQYEIHRNNLLYTNYTKNRNPFIDFPEWVDYIWGTATYNGTTYQSYSSTPTGFATPSSDTINGYNTSGESVSVTGVSLDKDSTSIETGSSEDLSFAISPSNATNKAVTWSSSDTSVATVSGGTVNAVSAGEATITITTNDGGFTDTCVVTVTGSSQGGEETSSAEGSSDLSSADTNVGDSAWDISGASGYYASPNGVKLDGTGKYILKNNIFAGKTSTNMTELKVTINSRINNSADETNSYKVEALDSSGKVLLSETKTGADVVTSSFSNAEFTLSNSTNNELFGCTGIRITYLNKGTGNWGIKIVSWEAKYVSRLLDHISLDTSGVKTSFIKNDDFDYSDLIVTAYYNDSSSENIFDYSVSTPDLSEEGEKTVTITYSELNIEKTATYDIEVVVQVPTSIAASVDRTFYVGETITKADIIVMDNFDNMIDEYIFEPYQFTYNDAPSGGSLANKQFNIAYLNLETTLTVQVERRSRIDPNVNDSLDKEATGNPSNYKSWSNVTDASEAVYAGHSNGTNNSIQLRSTLTNETYYSGIVSVRSGGLIKSVTVVWESHTANARILNVYGKNSAYTSPNDLYDSSKRGTLLGTIVNGTSTTLVVNGEYAFVGVCSNYGAMYLSSITFSYNTDSAFNLANYIMYEDTNNQCTTKFNIAKGYFEDLTAAERNTLMTSDDYVISTARERFEAWARHLNKSIVEENSDYVIKPASIHYFGIMNEENQVFSLTTIIISATSLLGLGLFLYKRKKHYLNNDK